MRPFKEFVMLKKLLAVIGAALLGLSVQVHAALPEGVSTAFAGVQSDFEDLFDIAYPIVLVFMGLMLIVKYTKRFGNKL